MQQASDALPCAIIGGGFAGMIAARRLQTLGLRPIVLERGDMEGGTSNARIARGVMHVAYGPLDDPPSELYARIMCATDGEADSALAHAVAAEVGPAVRWLSDQRLDIGPSSSAPVARFTLLPVQGGSGRRIIPEHGANKAMLKLYRAVREGGSRIVLGADVQSLRREKSGWRVDYVQGASADSVAVGSVLVCDGGFAADPQMLTRHVGPAAHRCLLRALPGATGSGLRMLMEHNAQTVGLGRIYGHMVSRTALTNDSLWPYPALDDLCIRSLLLDRDGERFAGRAADGVHLVNQIARAADPIGYTLVCDESAWGTIGCDPHLGRPIAPNPGLKQLGADYTTAPTLAALAEHLRLPPDKLMQAVAAHNADATRERIGQPPFHAMGAIPGITMTLGGPRVDATAAVIDTQGDPLPGVYAAGQTVGGLHAGPHGGYVGGLAPSLALAFIAARSIAAFVRGSATGTRPRVRNR